MCKCAIMQPHFFPWAGYFNLISSVDKFVFLNTAQFEKQSWQSRNRIVTKNGIVFLSIPIIKHSLNTKIIDIEILDPLKWKNKMSLDEQLDEL